MNYLPWRSLLQSATQLIVLYFLVSTGTAQERQPGNPSGDWRNDAPGRKHLIDLDVLPKPFATESTKNHPRIVAQPEGAELRVPEGFGVTLYASGLKNPRHLTPAPNGDIFVSESEAGRIRVLRDSDNDGSADQMTVFATGLKQPFGVAFYPPGPEPKYVYVANTDAVVRFPYKNGDQVATSEFQVITDLPSGGRLEGGGHWTRDIVFSPDGTRLFASVGSKTNVDEENEEIEQQRARVYVLSPEGKDKQPFATGIRNPVGLAIEPFKGELWASVNERDGLGDDLVPDYITHVQQGGFYGWPWSYLGKNRDPRHPSESHKDHVASAIVPDVLIQSHSATLCMTFYTGKAFPQEYLGNAFSALHGSWNRDVRTGYKIIRVPVKDGKAVGYYEDFLTGFVLPNGDVWGRPVGICVAKDGAMLISEDGNNTIWRIAPAK